MKIALIDDYRPAVLRGEGVVDISRAVPGTIMAQRPKDRMLSFIEAFDDIRAAIESFDGPVIPLDQVRLRAPVPRPGKLLMGQGNYHENVDGPKAPLGMFLKPSTAVLDPGGTVVLPPDNGEIFHHEAELAIIIGKTARNVSEADALNHVFGYSCLLDVSLRSQTAGVSLVAKGFDTFAPLGPWITTADDIVDPQTLSVRCWENGQDRQNYNTSDMEHPVAAIIAWASSKVTLEPGDVLGCGTNHQGIGPMQDGETCEIEIEKIGRMSVNVVDPLKRRWPFRVDAQFGADIREWKLGGTRGAPKNVFMQRIDN
ncbi:fumarylacetoacetate hydrolase family protein [Rhizorhabdus argentea]|uniref:fumarylacetoacetate hydrolase family protein n=1 Tax=Rhizorhabdus argentea TaxID=1387174 RepID=UPI0030EC2670